MTGRCAALAAAVFLAQAAEPVRVEQRIPLQEKCSGSTCRFQAPAGLDETHVRLMAGCSEGIIINGVPVGKQTGAWPLSGYLRSAGENRVEMAAGCRNPVLSLTPKVYIVSMELKRAGEMGRLSVLVENTLENTANISVEARLGSARAEVVGNVPAYGMRQFDMDLKLDASGPFEVESVMHKGAEAVEGSYLYRKTQTFE